MKTPEGFLKHDKMTEREFLREFAQAYLNDYPGPVDVTIDKFLAEFHKTYVPNDRWIVRGEAVWSRPGPNDCPNCGAVAHPGYHCRDYNRPLPKP